MSLSFIIYLYYTYILNTQYLTGSSTVLLRPRTKRQAALSSTPFVFLFNKAKRKYPSSLDIDIPEIQGRKAHFPVEEEITDDVPHVIVKIKTSEKNRSSPDETIINMSNYLVEDAGKDTSKQPQLSPREASKKPSNLRVLNLTKNMFDYNAQKIYHTVNGIRLRLSKEHDQRIILQTVQKQVEAGLRELKLIKEKCDKDITVLTEQKKTAMEKLYGLQAVMKQKKELDENLSKLLDHAVALNIERQCS